MEECVSKRLEWLHFEQFLFWIPADEKNRRREGGECYRRNGQLGKIWHSCFLPTRIWTKSCAGRGRRFAVSSYASEGGVLHLMPWLVGATSKASEYVVAHWCLFSRTKVGDHSRKGGTSKLGEMAIRHLWLKLWVSGKRDLFQSVVPSHASEKHLRV